MSHIDWYGVCCISIGRFRAKGGFGIVPPGYKLSNRHTTAKWTIYKGWERTDYDVVKEYDNESDACKAFLRAVQRRAKERGKLTEWWWQPNVD